MCNYVYRRGGGGGWGIGSSPPPPFPKTRTGPGGPEKKGGRRRRKTDYERRTSQFFSLLVFSLIPRWVSVGRSPPHSIIPPRSSLPPSGPMTFVRRLSIDHALALRRVTYDDDDDAMLPAAQRIPPPPPPPDPRMLGHRSLLYFFMFLLGLAFVLFRGSHFAQIERASLSLFFSLFSKLIKRSSISLPPPPRPGWAGKTGRGALFSLLVFRGCIAPSLPLPPPPFFFPSNCQLPSTFAATDYDLSGPMGEAGGEEEKEREKAHAAPRDRVAKAWTKKQ